MTTIFIVPLEPIDQRYTKQWYSQIPIQLQEYIDSHQSKIKIMTIDGIINSDITTDGAFLDFAQTNAYKASQVISISNLFTKGIVKPGDKFLFTDAWNFGITALKYMSDLLNIPVEIHGIWHAGNYDPSDILGLSMSKPWPKHVERSFFHSCDYNYFATKSHRSLFLTNLSIKRKYYNKAIISGQPYSYLFDECPKFDSKEKTIKIIYPHRINSDKQPEIFDDLRNHIVFYGLGSLMTKKTSLSKDEYYTALGTSEIVFSCSLHENLGIGMIEGVLCGAIPVVPDRCSYSEIYLDEFKYPSSWTKSFEAYEKHKDDLANFINDLSSIPNIDNLLFIQKERFKDFLIPSVMFSKLVGLK